MADPGKSLGIESRFISRLQSVQVMGSSNQMGRLFFCKPTYKNRSEVIMKNLFRALAAAAFFRNPAVMSQEIANLPDSCTHVSIQNIMFPDGMDVTLDPTETEKGVLVPTACVLTTKNPDCIRDAPEWNRHTDTIVPRYKPLLDLVADEATKKSNAFKASIYEDAKEEGFPLCEQQVYAKYENDIEIAASMIQDLFRLRTAIRFGFGSFFEYNLLQAYKLSHLNGRSFADRILIGCAERSGFVFLYIQPESEAYSKSGPVSLTNPSEILGHIVDQWDNNKMITVSEAVRKYPHTFSANRKFMYLKHAIPPEKKITGLPEKIEKKLTSIFTLNLNDLLCREGQGVAIEVGSHDEPIRAI